MDCNMPVLDGCQASALLKEKMDNGEIRTCPIVACTASTQLSEVNRCKDSGMNEYIRKPLRIDELKKILLKINLFTSYDNNNTLNLQSLRSGQEFSFGSDLFSSPFTIKKETYNNKIFEHS